MKNKKLIAVFVVAIVVIAIIVIISYKDAIANSLTPNDTKKQKLIDYFTKTTGSDNVANTIVIGAINRMSDEEIAILYDSVFSYLLKDKPIEPNLFNAFTSISNKYNLI